MCINNEYLWQRRVVIFSGFGFLSYWLIKQLFDVSLANRSWYTYAHYRQTSKYWIKIKFAGQEIFYNLRQTETGRSHKLTFGASHLWISTPPRKNSKRNILEKNNPRVLRQFWSLAQRSRKARTHRQIS